MTGRFQLQPRKFFHDLIGMSLESGREGFEQKMFLGLLLRCDVMIFAYRCWVSFLHLISKRGVRNRNN